ncbi:MAG: hypothetical protein H6586_02170 [Flavobacteriales bacterium]|nr:hypothetical protein [Flavobacteriales bacterium]
MTDKIIGVFISLINGVLLLISVWELIGNIYVLHGLRLVLFKNNFLILSIILTSIGVISGILTYKNYKQLKLLFKIMGILIPIIDFIIINWSITF